MAQAGDFQALMERARRNPAAATEGKDDASNLLGLGHCKFVNALPARLPWDTDIPGIWYFLALQDKQGYQVRTIFDSSSNACFEHMMSGAGVLLHHCCCTGIGTM